MIKDIIKYLFTLLSYHNNPKEANTMTKETPIAVKIEGFKEIPKPPISYKDYITANDKYPTRLYHEELTHECKENALELLIVVNAFLLELGCNTVTVTSGFRPNSINASTVGAGSKSKHLTAEAVDIADPYGKLMELILENLHIAQKHGVYFEDFRHTSTWVHIQSKRPNSGKRIFLPSMNPAPSPDRWDGKYDDKYDKVA